MSQEKEHLQIEPAMPADAEAIVIVHFAAVHVTGASAYPIEILDRWSAPVTPERIARMERIIRTDPDELVLVARQSGRVIGFGVIVPKNEELRAVYVHPESQRLGVGTALLKSLEDLARQHSVKTLNLSSAINVESFYLQHGYESLERGMHPIGGGIEMACIKMQKTLAI
jgi:GNAT superfamily N-acetyltransferase